jgi:phosphoadenosine phosphosulfate reductase
MEAQMALIESRLSNDGIITYDKVAIAIQTLRDYEQIALEKHGADGKNGYYVCISGGKDSSVIQQLCIMAGVKCQFYHSHTGLDHPETVYFIRREKKRLEECGYSFNIKMPKENIWQLVKRKKILPTRKVRYCCSDLKETGGRGRMIVTGVRRSESTKRKDVALAEKKASSKKDRVIIQNDNTENRRSVEHCVLNGTLALNIIVDWSDEDVWEFINTYNVPYNPLYDMGYKRVGCVGCPLSSHQIEELDDNPKYKAMWMRMCQWIVDNTDCNFKTATELYDWWTEKTEKIEEDENQTKLELEDLD